MVGVGQRRTFAGHDAARGVHEGDTRVSGLPDGGLGKPFEVLCVAPRPTPVVTGAGQNKQKGRARAWARAQTDLHATDHTLLPRRLKPGGVREATEQSPCELPDHTDQASRLHGRSLLYERAVITHPVGSAESASCITAHTAAGSPAWLPASPVAAVVVIVRCCRWWHRWRSPANERTLPLSADSWRRLRRASITGRDGAGPMRFLRARRAGVCRRAGRGCLPLEAGVAPAKRLHLGLTLRPVPLVLAQAVLQRSVQRATPLLVEQRVVFHVLAVAASPDGRHAPFVMRVETQSIRAGAGGASPSARQRAAVSQIARITLELAG